MKYILILTLIGNNQVPTASVSYIEGIGSEKLCQTLGKSWVDVVKKYYESSFYICTSKQENGVSNEYINKNTKI